MHVLVTGASGFIGTAVVADLLAAGHRVTGLARSPASVDVLVAAGAEVRRGDLDDQEGLRAAVAATEGVVHLGYRHGAPAAEAARTDRAAIAALGSGLAGSGRPLVVTSGTLVLPPGRVGTELDPADPDATAGPRAESEAVALGYAGQGVRVAVVRLAPSVHDRVRRGFVGQLVDSARRTGVSGYLGDGGNRWPAVHRLDAARLFRLALEQAPAGAVLHGVADEGVALRTLAEVIGRHLDLPVQPVRSTDAPDHFGWLGGLVGVDNPTSSALTRERLDWVPTHPGLVADLDAGDFFAPASA